MIQGSIQPEVKRPHIRPKVTETLASWLPYRDTFALRRTTVPQLVPK